MDQLPPIPPKRKMRLYDRLWQCLTPMAPEEVLYINQEREVLVQHQRVLAAEAERIELENRAKAAEVALVEEANERQREALKRFTTLARAEFGLRSKINNTWTPVTCIVSLGESSTGRQLIFKTIRTDTQTGQSQLTHGVKDFVERNEVFQLYFEPWLQGTLELSDLVNIKPDSCFEKISFVGNKKPG